jgi:hypothetical protein
MESASAIEAASRGADVAAVMDIVETRELIYVPKTATKLDELVEAKEYPPSAPLTDSEMKHFVVLVASNVSEEENLLRFTQLAEGLVKAAVESALEVLCFISTRDERKPQKQNPDLVPQTSSTKASIPEIPRHSSGTLHVEDFRAMTGITASESDEEVDHRSEVTHRVSQDSNSMAGVSYDLSDSENEHVDE